MRNKLHLSTEVKRPFTHLALLQIQLTEEKFEKTNNVYSKHSQVHFFNYRINFYWDFFMDKAEHHFRRL